MADALNSANMLNLPTTHSAESNARNSSASTTSNSDQNWHDFTPTNNSSVLGADRNPGGNDLDKDAFLKLLVTQLQYQDPLNPMEDTDFIAQLAQFSSLEQMQNMNNNTIKSQAFSMIGNPVIAQVIDPITGYTQEIGGIVSAVRIKNGEPFLMIGDKDVAMSDVVYTEDTAIRLMSLINSNLATSQHLELVGQYAQFVEREDNKLDGDIIGFVEGKIDSIKFDPDKGVLLIVGTQELSMSNIVGISSEALLIGKTITGTTTTNELVTDGIIKSVDVRNGDLYLVVEEGAIYIKNVTHVTDSLRHVGTEITHGKTKGIVDSVKIKAGVPYLVVDDGTEDRTEISYLDYAKIKDDEDDDD